MNDYRNRIELNPIFSRPGEVETAPLNTFPKQSMLPETAYQIVHDDSMLDGNSRLNLATFVSTWMDGYADKLYSEAYDKNAIDKDEYPRTAAMENHCWHMLADLWNAPDSTKSIGCSTTGSSEACMLGGLALKRRWQEKRRAAGKSTDKPNLVMTSAVQVCWEKFCDYFDIEARYVPISMEHKVMDGYKLEDYIDEHTIGVVVIMGVTYTGMYEPVAKIARKLDAIQKSCGLDIPIHVDGASGAMIAPFIQPNLIWDFRVDRVSSISTSGHKYGLVYPGIGWVVWRDASLLPESLIFKVSYLGGEMPTFALNFSRPGAQILLQYWAFLRYGFEGYQNVQQSTIDVARYLAQEIASMGPFELWNDASDIPVFAWMLKDSPDRLWTLYDLSDRLRMKGWQVPAYPMPTDLTDLTVQRIVVRNGLGMNLANDLLDDIRTEVAWLDKNHTVVTKPSNAAFHH
ncbi:MAG: glutamate decarboxylase [Eggerthellaceae bacterium]|jgi:glutamate decarboxylase|nr:glutamate decarboxylase [Eggerthellaceae bacterium]MCH4221647.1 glutamate decarboxylase [Eggerthellaceae bacterium]